MRRTCVPTDMRRPEPSQRARSATWLLGLSLVAVACTSTGPDGADVPSSDASITPSSAGWDARTTIAFHADPDGRDDTYVMDTAGTHLTPLSQPQGFGGLQDAMMQNVMHNQSAPPQGSAGGMPGGQKPQQQQMPPIGNMAGQDVNPAWNTALQGIFGQAGSFGKH